MQGNANVACEICAGGFLWTVQGVATEALGELFLLFVCFRHFILPAHLVQASSKQFLSWH